jgi:hypothetical protein
MVKDDMDPYDVEDIHPDVRAAMRKAGKASSGNSPAIFFECG